MQAARTDDPFLTAENTQKMGLAGASGGVYAVSRKGQAIAVRDRF
jgi:hypothetical protein